MTISLSALLLVATLPLPLSATIRSACSLVPSPRSKQDGAPYFLGRALPDTLPVGPGDVEVAAAPGHFGPVVDRPVYGQLVRVTQLGGSGLSERIRKATTAVVVPWDYDSACRPTSWAQSRRWLTLGAQLFFHPVLRPVQSWYRGMPTYDAFAPQFDAYPSRLADPLFGTASLAASAEQLFQFFEQMPTQAVVDSLGPTALPSLRRWADNHPHLAAQWPVATMIEELVSDALHFRARRLALAIRGTYRVEVTLPAQPTRTYYARTADLPSGLARATRHGDSDTVRSPWDTEVYIGVELWTMMTSSLDSLPPGWSDTKRADFPWRIAWPDTVVRDRLRAELDPWMFFPTNPRDPISDSAYAIVERHFDVAWNAGVLPDFQGAFSFDSDGRPEFREVFDFGEDGTLRIEAYWLSPTTIPRQY